MLENLVALIMVAENHHALTELLLGRNDPVQQFLWILRNRNPVVLGEFNSLAYQDFTLILVNDRLRSLRC